ncbi:unnamed protein product [Chrysodeixis includens]|uniref:Cystinosin n=1 Tax=Chrysodeixis includens TaxID=689277 RepID=A0A9P0C0V1_CHRIL|nr:unnamed protein product [Chrysodeixis includens]
MHRSRQVIRNYNTIGRQKCMTDISISKKNTLDKMAGAATVLKPRGARAPSSRSLIMCSVIVVLLGIPSAMSHSLTLSESDIKVLIGATYHIQIVQTAAFNTSLKVEATVQHPDILGLTPLTIDIPGGGTGYAQFGLVALAKSPGHSEVTFAITPAGYVSQYALFLRVTCMISSLLETISMIMGWIYFAAWSVSFYPQIYINYSRKSVVGLNFDFLALNITGFTLYSLFNCGLYFSKDIQAVYFSRFPRGLNPVQLNDVFFSTHAAFATIITITQCIIYERQAQRVSTLARCILGVFAAIVLVSGTLSFAGKLEWLDFLYYCSYIKLTITFIKYLPQAIMNYRRKSTVGWSIGNIFLDFTGGFLSIFQMVVNAHNYNDWVSFFGDFTKFGLGAFSLSFDIFFMIQHYVLYREGKEFVRVNSSDEKSDASSSSGEREYVVLVQNWNAEDKKYDLEAKA